MNCLLLLLFLNCCTNKVPPVNHTSVTDSFYLQKTNPVHNMRLARAFLRHPPEIMQFTVVVENKKLEPFNVNIFVTDSAASFPVGNFTAYPLNKGDNYIFRIDEPLKTLLSAHNQNKLPSRDEVSLRFVLEHDTAISNELRIGIRHFKWIEKSD